MGSRVRVDRWCDNHNGDESHQADERTYVVPGMPPRLGDTCDPCDDGMTLGQLRKFLAEFGRPVPTDKGKAKGNGALAAIERFKATGQRNGRTPAGERLIQCIWCPLPFAGSGFLQHAKDAHGFANQKDAWGRQCPVCGKNGIDMMGGHAIKSHADIDAKVASDLFVWARENGDPWGVYAARLEAGENVEV